MDGARLWEARECFAPRSLADLCAPFDSVYVSFYKGIGALAGAMLLGPEDFIAEARIWRRRQGGTLVQLHPFVASAAMRLDMQLAKMPAYRARCPRLCRRAVDDRRDSRRSAASAGQLFHVHFAAPPAALTAARDQIASEHGRGSHSASVPEHSRRVVDRDLRRRQPSGARQFDRHSTFCQAARAGAFAGAGSIVARAFEYAGSDVSRNARLSLSVQYAVAGDDLPTRKLLRRWASAALASDAVVTLRLVDTAEGATLNRRYRRKSGPTNVLSFAYDDRPGMVHGDVVLCLRC